MAERIQREVNMAAFKAQNAQASEIARSDAEIERLKKELEREQEWKPYEDTHNITQEQYTDLAESAPVRSPNAVMTAAFGTPDSNATI